MRSEDLLAVCEPILQEKPERYLRDAPAHTMTARDAAAVHVLDQLEPCEKADEEDYERALRRRLADMSCQIEDLERAHHSEVGERRHCIDTFHGRLETVSNDVAKVFLSLHVQKQQLVKVEQAVPRLEKMLSDTQRRIKKDKEQVYSHIDSVDEIISKKMSASDSTNQRALSEVHERIASLESAMKTQKQQVASFQTDLHRLEESSMRQSNVSSATSQEIQSMLEDLKRLKEQHVPLVNRVCAVEEQLADMSRKLQDALQDSVKQSIEQQKPLRSQMHELEQSVKVLEARLNAAIDYSPELPLRAVDAVGADIKTPGAVVPESNDSTNVPLSDVKDVAETDSTSMTKSYAAVSDQQFKYDLELLRADFSEANEAANATSATSRALLLEARNQRILGEESLAKVKYLKELCLCHDSDRDRDRDRDKGPVQDEAQRPLPAVERVEQQPAEQVLAVSPAVDDSKHVSLRQGDGAPAVQQHHKRLPALGPAFIQLSNFVGIFWISFAAWKAIADSRSGAPTSSAPRVPSPAAASGTQQPEDADTQQHPSKALPTIRSQPDEDARTSRQAPQTAHDEALEGVRAADRTLGRQGVPVAPGAGRAIKVCAVTRNTQSVCRCVLQVVGTDSSIKKRDAVMRFVSERCFPYGHVNASSDAFKALQCIEIPRLQDAFTGPGSRFGAGLSIQDMVDLHTALHILRTAVQKRIDGRYPFVSETSGADMHHALAAVSATRVSASHVHNHGESMLTALLHIARGRCEDVKQHMQTAAATHHDADERYIALADMVNKELGLGSRGHEEQCVNATRFWPLFLEWKRHWSNTSQWHMPVSAGEYNPFYDMLEHDFFSTTHDGLQEHGEHPDAMHTGWTDAQQQRLERRDAEQNYVHEPSEHEGRVHVGWIDVDQRERAGRRDAEKRVSRRRTMCGIPFPRFTTLRSLHQTRVQRTPQAAAQAGISFGRSAPIAPTFPRDVEGDTRISHSMQAPTVGRETKVR
jgi:hypothetical protein